MFTKAKNIDTAFRQLRLFAMVIVLGSLALTGFALWKSFQEISSSKTRVYVLANGKILEAVATDRKANLAVEARDHITVFHRLFFELEPDEKIIARNLSAALYLADHSARQQYENLKESGYYSSVIAGNISQSVRIDSIHLNTDRHPYFFTCYGTQEITRPTSLVERSLVTEGYMRNTIRSEHNPHGFLIERWRILENKDRHSRTR